MERGRGVKVPKKRLSFGEGCETRDNSARWNELALTPNNARDAELPFAPSEERLRVGDWAVEPELNQLSAAGKTVKLEPKAMAALIYLANRPSSAARGKRAACIA